MSCGISLPTWKPSGPISEGYRPENMDACETAVLFPAAKAFSNTVASSANAYIVGDFAEPL